MSTPRFKCRDVPTPHDFEPKRHGAICDRCGATIEDVVAMESNRDHPLLRRLRTVEEIVHVANAELKGAEPE
jgi:hypothetical protein